MKPPENKKRGKMSSLAKYFRRFAGTWLAIIISLSVMGNA
jgi:hypothetical protein